jgi:hypothetical protein
MNDADPNETTETLEVQSKTSVGSVSLATDLSAADAGVQPPSQIDDVVPPSPPDELTAYASQVTHAIRNAFLMGWSLQELKSTVLLSALGLPQSPSTGNPASKMGSTNGSSTAQTPRSLKDIVDKLLQDAQESALSLTSQMLGLPHDSNGNLAQSSECRANLIRLATGHNLCFPGSTTENTPYDPSAGSSPELRFPFLYPDTSSDYALIGINNSSSVGVRNFDDDAHLGKFKLYDVTRRALNCLSLLYTKPEGSLLPDLVSNFQRQIVESLSDQAQDSDKESQNTSNEETGNQGGSNEGTIQDQENANERASAIETVLEAYLKETLAGPSPDTLNEAIKSLSFLIVRFLDSWDGYLRENFYAGGTLQNNELELLAYEASSALSSLSSAASLMTTTLENASDADINKLKASWQNVFTSSYINSIERQISALGPALDDAYYILKKVSRPVAGERPNPDLPSTIIHAITYSLSYWQEVVDKMCRQANSDTTISTPTTGAATPTATSSATGSSSSSNETANLPVLTLESSRKLRQALITQAGIWQTLMLGQQTLRSFTAESVTRRILNNFMSEFETWVKQELEQPIQNEVNRFRTPMIVFGVLALVIVGGGIVLLAVTGQLQSLAAVIALFVGSALTLVSSGLTRAGSLLSPAPNTQTATASTTANNANLEERLGSLFGQAGETIVTVFQDAYQQILIEFDYLNHNVAISYPLIEFFTTNTPDISEDIKDGYYFLTNVVWTSKEREEELDRVTRAAFGPLGALIGTVTQKNSKNQPPPAVR